MTRPLSAPIRAVAVVALILAGGGLASCDDDADDAAQPASDPALVAFLLSEYGLRLELAAWSNTVEANDRIRMQGRYRVELDGERVGEVDFDETVDSAAAGGTIRIVLTDDATRTTRDFQWSTVESYFGVERYTAAGPDEAMGVLVLPDGDRTYRVMRYDVAAATETELGRGLSGREAYGLMDAEADLSGAPQPLSLAIFAIAHTAPPEARLPSSCSETAASPAFCDVFAGLCDCIPCLMLGQQDQCGRCP